MLNKDTLELLLATGRGQQSPNENTAGDPYFITPNGEMKGLSGFYPPRRIERKPKFQDVGSFIDYVNRFKTSATLIFAHLTEKTATLTAMLDYHGVTRTTAEGSGTEMVRFEPAYCRHVAEFTTIETPDWQAWCEADREPMGQVAFANFLEEYAHLFVQPSGADLLELVRSLHGHQNARFNTSLRLDSGAYSVYYEEDIVIQGRDSIQGGVLTLPPKIVAGISLFEGGPKYQVDARLKTRVKDRALALYFETINRPNIIRDNILLLTKQVGEKTGIIPMLGSA